MKLRKQFFWMPVERIKNAWNTAKIIERKTNNATPSIDGPANSEEYERGYCEKQYP
jgi:hypothetical protein